MTTKISPKRLRLSVAMIVRDEQDAIVSTLQSIHKIADEIVVLDTGSQDATAHIARTWGAKVRSATWNESFAEARNTCLDWTTGDWVLWLDAGERLSEKSAQKIREFIDGNPNPKNAYMMMVEVPPPDALASAEQIAQIRLMPRRAGLRFEGRIRENLHQSLTTAGMDIETAPGRILRHPREHDIARKKSRAQRNLEIVNLAKAEDPHENAQLLLAEGNAYSDLEMNDRAREAFSRAIDISSPGSIAMLEGYYGLLSCYINNPQLHDCQLECGLKALETFPFDVQLLLAMGSYLQGKDRLDLSSRSFEMAVKFGQVELTLWHLREVVEVATSCWSMILQLQGRTNEACAALEESLARYPHSTRLLRHGVELYIKMDEPKKATQLLEKLASKEDNLAALADVARGACRAAQSDWLAAWGYLQSAYLAGCRHPLCLRWLSVTLLGGGAIDAVRPILDEWRQLEPDHPEMLAYYDTLASADTLSESAIVPESAAQRPKERQYRFDSGVTTEEIAPLGLPIVHQFNSYDTMLPTKNG